MRITNTMITDKATININGNKINVDATNTQMTTQKKIDRPSEDPVIAIRSLRLQTSLAKINQYYERNIPDAESWMEVTETALLNTRDVFRDVHTLTVKGATGTLTDEDRDTILSQLKQLQKQIYSEGNSDYAGRTVFTGFRTDKNLTFMNEDEYTSYDIRQPVSSTELVKSRYYNNKVTVPLNQAEIDQLDSGQTDQVTSDSQTIQQTDYYRMRLAYDDVDVSEIAFVTKNTAQNEVTRWSLDININNGATPVTVAGADGKNVSYIRNDITFKDNDGTTDLTGEIKMYENEEDWANANGDKKTVGANDVVVIKSTGEVIFGETIAAKLQTQRAEFDVAYSKTGFAQGELRPEYYFNCVKTRDEYNAVQNDSYDRFDVAYEKDGYGEDILTKPYYLRDTANKPIDHPYSIDYTIAQNQTLGVNLEANQIFDHSLYQDMTDMTDAVSNAIDAHTKVEKIKNMLQEDQYQDTETQKKLNAWLELANKEMDYYDNNLSKLYSSMIGRVDGYLSDVNLSLTKLGCKQDQLSLTEKRMSDQQESVEELKSRNDDLDLSEIIIKYTSAYTAYQASLTAAGKLGEQTLLNYI